MSADSALTDWMSEPVLHDGFLFHSCTRIKIEAGYDQKPSKLMERALQRKISYAEYRGWLLKRQVPYNSQMIPATFNSLRVGENNNE